MLGIRKLICVLAAGAALVAASPAAAAESQRLQVPEAVQRDCLEPSEPGTAGIERIEWTAPASGILTARLAGGSQPDWDLAAFEGGEVVAASTSFTSRETATAFVESGDTLVLQACRLAGTDASIPLELDLYEMRAPAADDPRISLESVTISGQEDILRLERLGLDVTHDTESRSVTVAVYSATERALLTETGFEFTTVIRDLVAADAADRLAEARAAEIGFASTLPSGREEYRVYEDYTTEMKQLAADNPGLARSLEIGRTFEDRPIEGIEIAADVNRTDDGRPVYLNFGGHHAREWPASELPMEFALDLVASYNAGDPRVVSLLQRVRVVIVPVVNADGFIVSRNANGGVTTPADDDSNLTIGQAVADSGAYKRKNCRPTDPAQAAAPCAARTGSGVDLNRNYGAYWGGPGASTDPTTQSYRGTGPFSEPESEAVHQYTSTIHPTVFITNHTFTEGRWLRQPGFDADFLAQVEVPTYAESCAKNPNDDGMGEEDPGAISPDEAGMKSLGDAMASASEPDWISELGYETLCDITGATEDWNYFSQGTYGYTPEVRGNNFHANYADMVVAEYGEGTTGVGEAYLLAGERAADPAEHSVIEGPAPPGAILTLRKQFETATCESSSCPEGNGPSFTDVLETRLVVPADGTFEWQTNPSGRPLFPNETYTMSCRVPGGATVSRQVAVARGERVTENFSGCGPVAGGGAGSGGGSGTGGGAGEPVRCAGRLATIFGTSAAEVFKGTQGVDVIVGAGGRDKIETGKGEDIVCASAGRDKVRGGGGADKLRGGAGRDKLQGGGGTDRLDGGAGRDKIRGGGGKDRLRGGNAADRLNGGGGNDRCRGGRARDRLRSCP